MSKKLHVQAITNELAESAFFRRPVRAQPDADTPPPLPDKPNRQEEQPPNNSRDRATGRPPDEAANRPPDRVKRRRLLVRRGFEWYEDQLAALKRLSLQEQLEGKEGSMSAMVREALDDYLKKRSAKP